MTDNSHGCFVEAAGEDGRRQQKGKRTTLGQGLVNLLNTLGWEASVETQHEPLAASVARDARNFIGLYDAAIRQVTEQISVCESIIEEHKAIIDDQKKTIAAWEAQMEGIGEAKARLERDLEALEDEP